MTKLQRHKGVYAAGKLTRPDEVYIADEVDNLISALEAENERLLQLAADVLKAANWPDGDEICTDLQDIYAKHGLMVIVNATEPCGGNCACADWDAFPMECYRYSELLKAILNCKQEKQP